MRRLNRAQDEQEKKMVSDEVWKLRKMLSTVKSAFDKKGDTLKQAFRMADKSRDGKLDLREFINVLAKEKINYRADNI